MPPTKLRPARGPLSAPWRLPSVVDRGCRLVGSRSRWADGARWHAGDRGRGGCTTYGYGGRTSPSAGMAAASVANGSVRHGPAAASGHVHVHSGLSLSTVRLPRFQFSMPVPALLGADTASLPCC